MEYAKKSNLQYSGIAKYIITRKIAGRDCKVYKIQMKLGMFLQEYSFGIDQETGVCTEWQENTNIGNHGVADGDNYRYIEFKIDNIDRYF